VFDGSGGDAAVAVPAGVMASRRRLSRLSRLRLAARRDSSTRCTSTCCGLFFAQLSGNCHVPRSTRLYQITSPSPSRKIAFMESRRLLMKRNSLVRDGRLSTTKPHSRPCRMMSPRRSSRESDRPRSPHLPTAHHPDPRPRGSRRRLAEQSVKRCDWTRWHRTALPN
jgi:hypothetical protein